MQGLSTEANNQSIDSESVFAVSSVIFIVSSAIGAGLLPGWFTLGGVLVFGGAHNWFEYRYFLSRLPSRFGPFRPFFLTSFSGVLLLGALEVSMLFVNRQHLISAEVSRSLLLVFNELLILWGLVLYHLRHKGRETQIYFSLWISLVCSLSNLMSPQMFFALLSYVHCLAGLWIFDRELRRTRKNWLSAYHRCLWFVPLCVVALVLALNGRVSDSDATNHLLSNANAGFRIFPAQLQSTCVALYGFLQAVHYGIWILALPLATNCFKRWRIAHMPVARNRPMLAWALGALSVAGALLAMPSLWLGFALSYDLTNELYMAVATLHVLAELPFLVWMCED